MYEFEDLRVGDVIEVSDVPDRHGRNPKTRPAVVLDDARGPLDAITAVAVSATLPDLLPDTHVLLRWIAKVARQPAYERNRRQSAIGLSRSRARISSVIAASLRTRRWRRSSRA